MFNKFTDHKPLLISVVDAVDCRSFGYRQVWHYSSANWDVIETELQEKDWRVLQQGSVDDALDVFYKCIYDCMYQYIPYSFKGVYKSKLPWLTEQCKTAISQKHVAEGTARYEVAAAHCQKVLHEEQQKYYDNCRRKLASLPRGSKQWWTLSKQLLRKNASPSFFPPLKDRSGVWHREPESKAALLVKTFSSKNVLPLEICETLFFAHTNKMSSSLVGRRGVAKVSGKSKNS